MTCWPPRIFWYTGNNHPKYARRPRVCRGPALFAIEDGKKMKSGGAASSALLAAAVLYGLASPVPSAPKPAPIPHGQDRMPGPALSPAQALETSHAPEGLT